MKRLLAVVLTVALMAPAAGASGAATFSNWPAYLFNAGHSSVNKPAVAITTANAGILTLTDLDALVAYLATLQ